MFKHIMLLIVLTLMPIFTLAAHVDLSTNENGWTVFTPSDDSRILYVSAVDDAADDGNIGDGTYYDDGDAAIGSDPFNPTGPIDVYPTFAAAIANARTGYPDWILFKRGETYYHTSDMAVKSGRDSDEPSLIGAYGSGSIPLIKTGQGVKAIGTTTPNNVSWIAISSLNFYSSTRDPDSADYIDGTNALGLWITTNTGYTREGILIEGCQFRFYKDNGIQAVDEDALNGIALRRVLFADNYSSSTAHSQGLFVSNAIGLIIYRCAFVHNGWLVQSDGDGTTEEGEATPYNHNLYLSHCKNPSITESIFINGSSSHIKYANYEDDSLTGPMINNNLMVGGEIGISLGASDQHTQYWCQNSIVTNNVWVEPGASNPTNREIAWFFYNYNTDGGTFNNNLMAHQNDSSISGRFWYNAFSYKDYALSKNIIAKCKNITGFQFDEDEDNSTEPSGVSVYDNKLSITEGTQYIINAGDLPDVDGISFSGNQYYTVKESDTWFYVNDTVLSNAQWVAATIDDSIYTQPSFTDDTRNVDTYMTSIGETGTVDAFITAVRSQNRYDWDSRFEADFINDWIRAGFDMSITSSVSVQSGTPVTSTTGTTVNIQ